MWIYIYLYDIKYICTYIIDITHSGNRLWLYFFFHQFCLPAHSTAIGFSSCSWIFHCTSFCYRRGCCYTSRELRTEETKAIIATTITTSTERPQTGYIILCRACVRAIAIPGTDIIPVVILNVTRRWKSIRVYSYKTYIMCVHIYRTYCRCSFGSVAAVQKSRQMIFPVSTKSSFVLLFFLNRRHDVAKKIRFV